MPQRRFIQLTKKLKKIKEILISYSEKKNEMEGIIGKYISSLQGGKIIHTHHVNDVRCTTLPSLAQISS